jgi:hypothetical protein
VRWLLPASPAQGGSGDWGDLNSGIVETARVEAALSEPFAVLGEHSAGTLSGWRGLLFQPNRSKEEHMTLNELFLQDISGYAPTGYKAVEAKLTLPVFEQKFRTWLLEDYHHWVR